MKKYTKPLIGLGLLFAMLTASGQEEEMNDIMNLSLEELMNIEIISVSKQSERLQDVAAAVYVITEEDIRRSGATRLQDVLFMNVPGLFFDFLNYQEVEFGIRSQTKSEQGSVLVLVDNVPYQSPFTSAFEFADFDFDLEEIDRIEVIRGPGGTIYGANAATGVINIYTKQNQEGWRATTRHGSDGFFAPSIRYATNVSEKTNIKVSAKGNFFNGFHPIDQFNGERVTVPVTDVDPITGAGLGTTSRDTTIVNQLDEDIYKTEKFVLGFNFVSEVAENTNLSAHSYYINHQNRNYFLSPTSGLFFDSDRKNSRFVSSIRIDRNVSENHSFFLQGSGNKETFDGDIGTRTFSTLNLEFQDNLTVGIHHLSSGINVRSVDFRVSAQDPLSGVQYTEQNTTKYLWGAFVQDQLRFSDQFDVTLGVKAETWTLIDNKPEWSPSLRFSYRPSSSINIWGAASRSVTTPGFLQTNVELTVLEAIPPVLPFDVRFISDENIDQSEYLTGEFGVKASGEKFSLDVSTFYIKADKLIEISSLSTTPVPSQVSPGELIFPIAYANIAKSTSYGVETVFNYLISNKSRLELSHAWFSNEFDPKTDPFTGQPAIIQEEEAPVMPEHVVRLKSYTTIGENLEISLLGIYNTKTGETARFFYDQQRPESSAIPGDTGIALHGGPTDRFRMDIKLEQFFSDRKASIFLWANDVLNNGEVLSYTNFRTGVPMQVARLYGLGASVKF